MSSTEPSSEKVFGFQQNFRINSVKGNGDVNRFYHKINMNCQLRYGVILSTNNYNRGEFIEIRLQGNREEVNRAHFPTEGGGNNSYRGNVTLNGRLFEDTIFIIGENGHSSLLRTFWPDDQHMDQKPGNKVIAPTDYLITLSQNGYAIDPNIVAGPMHKAFVELTKEVGVKHFNAEVYVAQWDEKVKEEMGLKIEDLKEQNIEKGLKIEDLEEHVDTVTEDLHAAKEQRYVAEEEAALAKEETAVEKEARIRADKKRVEAEAELANFKILGKKAFTTSAETGKSSVRHAEVYILVKSELVSQYGKKTIEITLEDPFGNTTTSWNNWDNQMGRLIDKYAQSNALVGQKIQYDTWGGFSPQWFNNLYLVE